MSVAFRMSSCTSSYMSFTSDSSLSSWPRSSSMRMRLAFAEALFIRVPSALICFFIRSCSVFARSSRAEISDSTATPLAVFRFFSRCSSFMRSLSILRTSTAPSCWYLRISVSRTFCAFPNFSFCAPRFSHASTSQPSCMCNSSIEEAATCFLFFALFNSSSMTCCRSRSSDKLCHNSPLEDKFDESLFSSCSQAPRRSWKLRW
mmetsp:Transcript_1548/g.4196  ORF Transcript_1548/g.4196 Transcript_1548/m.4196 type:complete len:204 (-) Transcript_1548:274-885(-)